MSKEYFLAYHSYLEPIRNLSEAEVGRLFLAALEYSVSGKLMELKGNEKFAFAFIKQQIDRDNRKYAEKCRVLKENGKYGNLGGRPMKTLEGFEKPIRVKKTLKEKGKTKTKGNTNTNTNTKGNNINPSVLTSVSTSPQKGGKSTPLDPLFDEFWFVYPKKIGKLTAMKVFEKIPKIEETQEFILAGVEKWKASTQWQDPQYIPYPATFLKNRRWEDEIQDGGANYARSAVSARKPCTEYTEGDDPPEGLYDA
jgi:hypothetical protein